LHIRGADALGKSAERGASCTPSVSSLVHAGLGC
jgi:hypothetical protein